MNKYTYWSIIIALLISIFAGATFIVAQTVNIDPYGRAMPRMYDVTTYGDSSAIGAYYLDFPTLSANDTIAALALTQTFTNKTLTSPTITGATMTTATITNPVVTTGEFTTPYLYDPNMAGTPKITGATGTMKMKIYVRDDMPDDATADPFPDAVDGFVIGMANPDTSADRIGCWVVGADGTVLEAIDIPSGYVDDASTDGDLCLYEQGTGTVIANRCDETADVRFIMFYE